MSQKDKNYFTINSLKTGPIREINMQTDADYVLSKKIDPMLFIVDTEFLIGKDKYFTYIHRQKLIIIKTDGKY